MLSTGLLLIAAAVAQAPPGLPGQGTTFSMGAEAPLASRYVWRGMPASQGPTVQPSIWLGAEDMLLTGWANINLMDEDGRGLNEFDVVLSMAQDWGEFSFLPAMAIYLFPNDGTVTWTAEATGDFAWQPGPLGVYWNNAIDFWDARPGYWTEAGGALELDLPANLGLSGQLGISFANKSFNAYYTGLDRYGLQYLTAGVGLGWSHTTGLYAGLTGRLDLLPVADLRDALGTELLVPSALLAVGWDGSLTWVKE